MVDSTGDISMSHVYDSWGRPSVPDDVDTIGLDTFGVHVP